MSKARNGEGSLRHDAKSGKWIIEISLPAGVDGKRKRTRRTFDTLTEAKKGKLQLLGQRDQGKLTIVRSDTVFNYGLDWIHTVKSLTVRPTTANDYEARLRREIQPYLGHLRLVDLTAPQVDAWLSALRRKGLSADTTNGARRVLNMLCKHAQRTGVIPHNPVAATDPVRRQASDPTHVREPWGLDEVNRVLDAAIESPIGCFLHLMLHTGLRPGEALGMRWVDVDLPNRQFFVTGTLKDERRILANGKGVVRMVRNEPKTAASRRRLPISDALQEALIRHQTQQAVAEHKAGLAWKKSGYVLTTSVGTPISASNNRRKYKEFLTDIEVRYIRPHDLRHTVITLVLNEGDLPIEKASAAAGHTRIDTTKQIYGKVIPRYNDAFIDCLSPLLPQAPVWDRSLQSDLKNTNQSDPWQH